MNWKLQPHPLEIAAAAISVTSLGGATAFAIFALVPRTGHLLTIAASLGGLMATCAGLYVLSRVGAPRRVDSRGFRLVDFVDAMGEPVALEPWSDDEAAEDELLLDDPIASLDPDSRVIRLFQPEQPEPLPEPLPEPGQLVARIADYLGSGRGAASPAVNEPVRHDASDALHAALADIRRSLG